MLKPRGTTRITQLLVAFSMAAITACSAPERLKAVPDDATMRAEIPGMPGTHPPCHFECVLKENRNEHT